VKITVLSQDKLDLRRKLHAHLESVFPARERGFKSLSPPWATRSLELVFFIISAIHSENTAPIQGNLRITFDKYLKEHVT